MNEPKIAAALLTFLASGGTMERALHDLPGFKAELQSAFEWMKKNGRCTDVEIDKRAMRLREAVLKKDEAIKKQDFDLAAGMRAKECAIYESLGLYARAITASMIPHIQIDEQIRHLSGLLTKMGEPEA